MAKIVRLILQKAIVFLFHASVVTEGVLPATFQLGGNQAVRRLNRVVLSSDAIRMICRYLGGLRKAGLPEKSRSTAA